MFKVNSKDIRMMKPTDTTEVSSGLIRPRRSHVRCSIKKAVLENFAIFTGKQLCWSLFYKVTGFQACNFIGRDSKHR